MGRLPLDEPDPGQPSAKYPFEVLADGCPGGWYRTAYMDSVAPYVRRRTDGGGRVPNPRFDAAPWQVQAAAMIVELEQERWHAEIRRLVSERAQREADKRAKKAGKRGPRR